MYDPKLTQAHRKARGLKGDPKEEGAERVKQSGTKRRRKGLYAW
jgi:hypothetical protein